MNLSFLMNIRPTLEEALRGWFAQQGVNAFTRQNAPENFQTVRPRTEITAKIRNATGHKYALNLVAPPAPPQNVLYNDAWFFDLSIRCVVQPQNVEADNLLADQYVALVRGMMQTYAQATWADPINFPNVLIVEPLTDTTTDDSLQVENNDEFSVLTYTGIVQIRTEAWSS